MSNDADITPKKGGRVPSKRGTTYGPLIAMKDWDAVRPTEDCLHCRGTGLAPGDGRTKCGFCK